MASLMPATKSPHALHSRSTNKPEATSEHLAFYRLLLSAMEGSQTSMYGDNAPCLLRSTLSLLFGKTYSQWIFAFTNVQRKALGFFFLLLLLLLLPPAARNDRPCRYLATPINGSWVKSTSKQLGAQWLQRVMARRVDNLRFRLIAGQNYSSSTLPRSALHASRPSRRTSAVEACDTVVDEGYLHQ
ncbi:hypothetical protein CDEST_12142 [Colletotrichum destructivum]|uniref:Uncharacterized protein n=1 Tax=Colletotrichum destructivum TaxID=34406 RepID=A0AAX4IVK5_9PEZI|nr:hypothetical protein CDEST_12142 [Colletotrichum destructivum]